MPKDNGENMDFSTSMNIINQSQSRSLLRPQNSIEEENLPLKSKEKQGDALYNKERSYSSRFSHEDSSLNQERSADPEIQGYNSG